MLNSSNETIKNGILLEFAKTIELFELSPLEARVFTILYMEAQPLTLDELSEALGKSKTSMSNSVRSLVDLNLVKRVWKKGVRKDLYQANSQLFKHFMNSYLKKWLDATSDRKDALLEIQGQIEQITTDERNRDLEKRLLQIMQFHKQLEEFFYEASQIKKDDYRG
ncbi:transcriptional regulator [Ornithinibacillus massiliensis]|uniref:HTH-type transcriptional regulator n=1 Tax=Ornithinibacillus massiliensis TaxID=1944633 RepID=A0ABS5MEL9_9BACI|nr:helix-turn-helix domain-containing protein [Ornithinibacillus massiliensis]MBS3680533.1 transcriptional regulator [Ornithinibacillus massiliensis]